MQSNKKTIVLSQLVLNSENPRLVTTGEHLIESIRQDGLTTRLLVEPTGDGKYTILQGNSRFIALQVLESDTSFDFKGAFPKGVPCEAVDSWDYEGERGEKIADHGLVKPLRSVYELALSVRVLMNSNPKITRAQLVGRLANSLDLVFPLREPATLEKVRLAREKGPIEGGKVYTEVRAGVTQLLQAIATGPKCLEEHYKALAMEKESPMAVTRAQVAELMKAFKADCDYVDENGIHPFDRINMGPTVAAKIEDIKTANAVKEGSASERASQPKPLNKTELETVSSSCTSRSLKIVMSKILGLSQVDLSVLDGKLLQLEQDGVI